MPLRRLSHELSLACFVSHDARLREGADTVLWLEDGKLLEEPMVAARP